MIGSWEVYSGRLLKSAGEMVFPSSIKLIIRIDPKLEEN